MVEIKYKRSISKLLSEPEPEIKPPSKTKTYRFKDEEREGKIIYRETRQGKMSERYKDWIGVKIHKLTMIGFEHEGRTTIDTDVRLLCDCGNIKITDFACFKAKHIKSCGYLRGRGKAWETRRKNQNVQQGSECSKESCETITNG